MAQAQMGLTNYIDQWRKAESTGPLPTRARHVVVVQFNALVDAVLGAKKGPASDIVSSLYAGDIWIFKNTFTVDWMKKLKTSTVEYMHSRPPTFYKMLQGSPDFHRIIDLETGKRYSFECCKHSAYFYRWNDDPLGIWPEITDRWRFVKALMGLNPTEYERNTPKDGVVDRVQVVRYPPSIGFLEPHADPHLHQRLFFSGYMSRRGIDFEGGGFYVVDRLDRVYNIEPYIEVGDTCVGYATVYHGVAPCDRGKAPDWNADDGRWFLSMYSNASDEVPNRHTGRPVKLNLPGVLP